MYKQLLSTVILKRSSKLFLYKPLLPSKAQNTHQTEQFEIFTPLQRECGLKKNMNLLPEDRYSRKSTVIQIALSVLANLGLFLSGMSLGFPSVILGPLVDSTGPGFHASIEEGSWVASIAHISAPIGCLLGGPLVERLGCRRGLQLLNIANITGWFLITLVPFPLRSLTTLIIGRILTGFGSGLATPAATTYTAEIVTPRLRTMLVTLSPVMMGVGIFVVYLLADLFQDQWTIAAGVGTGVSVFSALFSAFLPESPLWLLSKNKPEEAHNSLMTVRGVISPHEVQDEFVQMTKNALSRNTKTTWSDSIKNMCRPETYKPLLIMNMFFLFQQTSGISIIIIYGVEFAKEAEIPRDAYTVALFIGIVRVVSTFLTTWACNRWGRRIPAIAAGIGMTLSLLGLTAYVGLRHRYPDTVPSTTLIPAFCIFLNIFTSSVGFSTLPWSMLGEVFPTKVRGVCCGLTSCIAYFMSFIGIKFYLIVEPLVGNIVIFSFFGVSSFIGTLFLAIFLPETHGKTLQDIENYFRGTDHREKTNLNIT